MVDDPTAFATRTGDSALYVNEQAGRVRAVRNGTLDPQPVLDITDQVGSGGERGLLGLAFAPDGSEMYVYYTNLDGDIRIDEYAMSGNSVNAGSRRQVLAVDHPPASNHNGGQLSFGPDGKLYAGLGDGGAAGDAGPGHVEGGNAQSLDTMLGKILRIDPTPSAGRQYTIPSDNPFANGGGLPEIWAYGLRNPWRFSWDRKTGDMWIADVGQNQWEEVDFVPAGRGAGANYGWNRLEGTHQFSGSAPERRGLPHLRVLARERRLLHLRRLCVPRDEDSGARRATTCTRTTATARSAPSANGTASSPANATWV